MQVSGLVLTLSVDVDASRRVPVAAVRRIVEQQARESVDARIEVGVSEAPDRLPLVLEAASARSSKAAIAWLEGITGVERVDVVFVGDLEETQEAVSCKSIDEL